jgi:hypothetical protein
MVYLVFKLVPVYTTTDKVPKKYLNLQKPKYVTCFKVWYPNAREILVEKYGLKPDDKIIVYWTKKIDLPNYTGYRTKFRKVWKGRLGDSKLIS